MALLGIMAIQELRQRLEDESSKRVTRLAHVLHSLKRPEEVKTLREIYGPALVVLAAYSPREKRRLDLAKRIAESHSRNQSAEFGAKADELLKRDEAELADPCGQDVEETFPVADVFINTSDPASMTKSINRAIDLLFGNVFITPAQDEQGMYLARCGAFRSSSLARQVGAAICRPDGTIVALGMNDVPKAGGGAYWSDGGGDDGRDFQLGHDTSDKMRENIFAEILERLGSAGWLDAAKAEQKVNDLVREALREGERPFMKGAQFLGTIDYVRAVHAEMAAITDAARHGQSTVGCTLYTTTFPCHDCAKHIVAAGISRVVYVEPYRKSLVEDLYPDSVEVDPMHSSGKKVTFEPFVGVAPRRYSDFFDISSTKRKNKDGSVKQWRPAGAVPRLPEYLPMALARLSAERLETQVFLDQLKSMGLAKNEEQN